MSNLVSMAQFVAERGVRLMIALNLRAEYALSVGDALREAYEEGVGCESHPRPRRLVIPRRDKLGVQHIQSCKVHHSERAYCPATVNDIAHGFFVNVCQVKRHARDAFHTAQRRRMMQYTEKFVDPCVNRLHILRRECGRPE